MFWKKVAYVGLVLTAEWVAELQGRRLIHTPSSKAQSIVTPSSPGRRGLEAFGAKVGLVMEG